MEGGNNLHDLIDDMFYELSSIHVTAEQVDKSMKRKLSTKHTGNSISKEEREKRKIFDCFSFFSLKNVDIALNEFFGCTYNLKRVARECVLLDEGDKFTESLDVGVPLGILYNSRGEFRETSIIELTLKVRAWGSRNSATHLPFDIVSFRLIADDMGQWKKKVDVAKEKKIDESSFRQLNIYDFLTG